MFIFQDLREHMVEGKVGSACSITQRTQNAECMVEGIGNACSCRGVS